MHDRPGFAVFPSLSSPSSLGNRPLKAASNSLFFKRMTRSSLPLLALYKVLLAYEGEVRYLGDRQPLLAWG